MYQFSAVETGGRGDTCPALQAPISSKPLGSLSVLQKAPGNGQVKVPASESSRSTTPTTDSLNGYTSSVTSWASSGGRESDRIFPKDDENDSEGSKWGDEASGAPRRPPPRPMSVDDSSGPSEAGKYRHFMSALSPPDASLDEDSEMSDSEYDEDQDDDEGDDNEWSGEDGSLEETVIAAVEGDLSLAAFLIPLIHQDLNSAVKNKVESWQYSAASGQQISSSDCKSSKSATASDQSQQNPRKRRRRSSSGGRDGGGEGDEGDEDEKGGAPGISSNDGPQEAIHLLLACPFHKLNPAKYGIQHGLSASGEKHHYRACAGPGFKSIQRLKEHLKRKHTPVQCDRCYQIFPGNDRAANINQLTNHLQRDEPCERGDPSHKEGISDAQWASLEKQNRKKNQESHRVAKWFEIWDIIFPKVQQPKTPWYDDVGRDYPHASSSQDGQGFSTLFLRILDHRIQLGDINFHMQTQDQLEQLKERLRSTVQQTFKAFFSLQGSVPPTNSSSSFLGSNNLSSLVGGSSTHISRPSNSASHQMTTTSLSSAQHAPQAPPSPQPPPQQQQQQQQPPQQQSPQPAPAYTLNHLSNSTAAAPSYAMAIPMSRQSSQYQAAPMPAPAMPHGVPMSNFPSMGVEDLQNYYPLAMFSGQSWSPGMQYPAMQTNFQGGGQLNPAEGFFGQPEGFGQGTRDGDFGSLQ